MYTHPQRRTATETRELRIEAGAYLRKLREDRGLSQRALADAVGLQFYTFISQIETGRGRLPPDQYLLWAKALDVDPKPFVINLLQYYDPITYDIVFGANMADQASDVVTDTDVAKDADVPARDP